MKLLNQLFRISRQMVMIVGYCFTAAFAFSGYIWLTGGPEGVEVLKISISTVIDSSLDAWLWIAIAVVFFPLSTMRVIKRIRLFIVRRRTSTERSANRYESY